LPKTLCRKLSTECCGACRSKATLKRTLELSYFRATSTWSGRND